ncbi:MAG: hypothetical protein RL088_124 [Verrucomicrobiota bacterium]
MELYQLEYFIAAARERSFTRAARRLNLAQAALSEQMRNLEAELGSALFHRGRRETTLTAAGETLLSHAEGLLARAADVKRAVTDVGALRSGRLAIGAIPSVSACVLPAVIARFCKRYPTIELSVIEGTSGGVVQCLESGQVELGVVQLPTVGAQFQEILLFNEPFAVLVPRSHPFANRRQIGLAALAAEGFIFYKGRARDAALSACRSAGFEPRIACESSELETIRSLVAAGLGIALLPGLALKQPGKHCNVVRLAGSPLKRDVGLLCHRSKQLSPAATEFVALLRATRFV